MKRLMLIAILIAASGCSSSGTEPGPATMTPADIAGRYGQSGHVGSLELDANGVYECFVINGLTIDGCGTFAGAGVSKGSWALDRGSISFVPMSEPADLLVKLSEASAVPAEDGLVLTIGGTDYFLTKHLAQTGQLNKPLQTDRASPNR